MSTDLRTVGLCPRCKPCCRVVESETQAEMPCVFCGDSNGTGCVVCVTNDQEQNEKMNTYTKDDWREEVASGNTVLGYAEWLEHKQEEDEQQAYRDMEAELESGDCAVVQCTSSRTTTIFCGKELHVGEDESAFTVIAAEMEGRKYWPNIYHINDHGNVSLCDKDGKRIKSWV